MEDLDPQRLQAGLDALAEGPAHAPERIDALIQLGWAIALSEPQRAEALTAEAAALSQAHGYARGTAVAKRNRAYLLVIAGRAQEALPMALQLMDELQALGDLEAKASTCDMLFHCYERVGDLKMAMQYNLQNLELNREVGNPRGEAWALHNMGSVTTQMQQPDKAIAYYEQALALFRQIDYLTGESRVYSRLGLVHRAQGNHEQALAAQEHSRDLSARLNLPLGVALACADIGQEHEALGRPQQAREYYLRAIETFADHPNRASIAETHIRLARLEVRSQNFEQAKVHLDRAFETVEGTGAKTVLMRGHEAMAELCEAQGDLAGTLRHVRAHHSLFAEVYDIESNSELRNLHIRMEMQEAAKDAEIHRLRYVELESMQAQLLQAERMAALGGLAAGLGHEVNTPLGVIRSNLDLTERAAQILDKALPAAPERPRKASAALDALHSAAKASRQASERIMTLVQSLRRFVRLDESEFVPTDIVEGLQSALTLLAPSLPKGVQIKREFEVLPVLECYASELNQAFMTLLRNAGEAIDGEGVVTVRTALRDAQIEICIEDTGRGMSESQVAELFELGFHGSGQRVRFQLGLPTAATAVRKHGGDIEVHSELGVGTRFVIRLPVPQP